MTLNISVTINSVLVCLSNAAWPQGRDFVFMDYPDPVVITVWKKSHLHVYKSVLYLKPHFFAFPAITQIAFFPLFGVFFPRLNVF